MGDPISQGRCSGGGDTDGFMNWREAESNSVCKPTHLVTCAQQDELRREFKLPRSDPIAWIPTVLEDLL